MTGWWRRLVAAFQPVDQRDLRRQVAELQQQNDTLYRSLVAARALQVAAEDANNRTSAKLQRIQGIVASHHGGVSGEIVLDLVAAALLEDGPVSGGGQQ